MLGLAPMVWLGNAVLNAVASEGKLAAVVPMVVLINDAADRVRIGGVLDPVQDDLRDRRLADMVEEDRISDTAMDDVQAALTDAVDALDHALEPSLR